MSIIKARLGTVLGPKWDQMCTVRGLKSSEMLRLLVVQELEEWATWKQAKLAPELVTGTVAGKARAPGRPFDDARTAEGKRVRKLVQETYRSLRQGRYADRPEDWEENQREYYELFQEAEARQDWDWIIEFDRLQPYSAQRWAGRRAELAERIEGLPTTKGAVYESNQPEQLVGESETGLAGRDGPSRGRLAESTPDPET